MNGSDGGPETQPDGVLPSGRRHEGAAESVDPEEILEQVAGLDVRRWRAGEDEPDAVEHLAPSAEEFYDAFEVGADPGHVAAGDADGVALAAIQGMAVRLEAQQEVIERQNRRIEDQRAAIEAQRDDLESLRESVESIVSGLVSLRASALDHRQP